MPQAVAALPAIMNVAAPLATAGSSIYGLYDQYKNNQYQSKLRDLATNPAKMNALAQGYTQPLNAGLEKGVANQSQAYLAERGLSSSPQISDQVESQAISPYIQQNQQLGYENALRALGLGGGAINPAYKQATGQDSLAQVLAMLKGQGGMNSGTFGTLMNSGRVMPGALDLSSIYPSPLPAGDPGLDTSSLAPTDLSSWFEQSYGGQ